MNSDESDDTSSQSLPPSSADAGVVQNHESSHPVGTCAEAVAELFTYLDGALTDDRRGLIQAHLDDCAPCFEAYEFHVELRTVVQQRCRSELPEGLRDRIFEQILSSVTDAE